MQCKKCEIDIPSQFEFVLAQNVCPKCGNKLMPDAAMAVYLDLKKRLQEVEFVMDKTTVCERVAMFLITNYEVAPLGTIPSRTVPTVQAPQAPQTPRPQTAAEKAAADAAAVAKFKAELAAIANGDDNLSAEEIRAEEAARAEELAIAREMGMDPEINDSSDFELEDGEELVTGAVDASRLQRLKKLAATSKISKSGQVGMIKRSS